MLGVRPSRVQKHRSVQTQRPAVAAFATGEGAAALNANRPLPQASSVECATARLTSTWYLPEACAHVPGLVATVDELASQKPKGLS